MIPAGLVELHLIDGGSTYFGSRGSVATGLRVWRGDKMPLQPGQVQLAMGQGFWDARTTGKAYTSVTVAYLKGDAPVSVSMVEVHDSIHEVLIESMTLQPGTRWPWRGQVSDCVIVRVKINASSGGTIDPDIRCTIRESATEYK